MNYIAQSTPLGLTPEQLTAAGGTVMLAIVLILLMRGELLTKRSHEQTVLLLRGIITAKDEEIGRIESDRNLWRDVAADALDLSETLAGHGSPHRPRGRDGSST